MSNAQSTLLGLYWDRGSSTEGDGDLVDPEDTNRPARYLEHAVAQVLLWRLVEDGIIQRSHAVPTIDEATARIAVPPADDAIIGFLYGRAFIMNNTMEADGTANGGDTTYLLDNARTEADDFWNDAYILFTSGANSGQIRQVTDFTSTSGRLMWSAALPAAVQSGDTYTVTFYYIQNLTNDAVNWVYARALGRTARDAVVQWVANTSGDKATGDILVATVSLDAAGAVLSADNDPVGADRNLWTGAGAVHQIRFQGTVLNLPAGGYIDITLSHDPLVLLGPVSMDGVLDDEDCEAEVINAWEPDEFVFRITNNASYDTTVSYDIRRWGRKKIYL